MRKFNIFLALALLFTSCLVDDVQYIENGPINTDGGLKIIGAVQDFDVKRVSTRADESEQPSDSFISEMTMFVFDKNGKIVQGYLDRTVNDVDEQGNPKSVTFDSIDKCTSAINIQKANPTFLIDTKAGIIASLDEATPRTIYYDNIGDTGNNDLSECKIYIVANAWHELESRVNNITDLATLEAFTIPIDATLAMPKKDDTHYRGFPMIGTHADQTFNLTSAGNNEGAVAKIPLKKLYAKINFTIQVNANQVVNTPKFQIEKVEVFNVPNKARLGRALDSSGKPAYGTTAADDYINEMVTSGSYTPSNYYQFTESAAEVTNFSRKEIYHSTSKTPTSEYLIEFGFYMPEHKVTHNYTTTPYPYPFRNADNTIPADKIDFMQYYKPELVGAVRNADGTTTNGKYATFVRIHGTYTDHNGQIKTVRYDIYLGQNNTDDFTVKRNQLLNNKLVITGLTNYHDAYADVEGNISIDHRVDVDYKGFNLSMERTAILDSHFEVRPLDVELSPGSTMTVTIPEAYRSWVAMEDDAEAMGGSLDVYINNSVPRKGVRKYFTTNLVSDLTTANSGKIELTHSGATDEDGNPKTEIFRIWFYIDENPNVYDKLGKGAQSGETGYTVGTGLYRNCPVEFKYYGTDNDNTGGEAATVTKTVTVNFQQWNLWRVWNSAGTRYYDIEHEEEYLNNYASDQTYGGTQNGMPFGLEGIQLSDGVLAYYLDDEEEFSGIFGWIQNWLAEYKKQIANTVFKESGQVPYYDFYLSRDGFPTDKLDSTTDLTQYARDYQGLEFNQEIATTLKALQTDETATQTMKDAAKIDGITLTEDPKSAFAYCYHKNKRDADGNVVDQKWCLPAIDEIEEIALGAYDEFDKVFQNQKYWSCQPSYENKTLGITLYQWSDGIWGFGAGYNSILSAITGGEMTGAFYSDNIYRARATSVYSTSGTDYSNINSGMPSGVSAGKLSVKTYDGGEKDKQSEPTFTPSNIDYDNAIYQDPDGEYRGNLPRNTECRIRAVYRSGAVSTSATE